MKVLVTGGGGFLGAAICRLLLARGDAVVTLQRSPPPADAPGNVDWRRGDIANAATVADAAHGCEAIIHTAAKAGDWGPEADYRRANVQGTRNVLEACRSLGIPWLVHTSSPSVVHAGRDIEGGDEALPIASHFTAAYPETKAEAERLVLAADGSAAGSATLRTVTLRPHLIWGPGDPHLLPRLVEKARRGRLALPGADKRIDTVYVDNAAQAHLDALDTLRRDPDRCGGKAYFISNGEPRAQGEVIAALLKAAGVEVRIVTVPAGLALAAGSVLEKTWRALRLKSEPPVTRFAAEHLATAHWFDISAARRDLGYAPAVSIDEGLRRLARWHAGEA